MQLFKFEFRANAFAHAHKDNTRHWAARGQPTCKELEVYASRVPYRTHVQCIHASASAMSAICTKLIRQCATISDEPVVFLDLSLAIYTLRVKKKPLLSLLSIKSEEGGSDHQMTPELLIET